MIKKIFQFYVDGFRQMRLGKILWAIIGIKLFVMFVILKLFFFPNTISEQSELRGVGKSEFVADEILERSTLAVNDTTETVHGDKTKLKHE